MNKANFSLIPFSLNTAPKINITGSISRQDNLLTIEYLLSGNLTTILLPQAVDTPRRQNNLWEHSCFEFFLKLKDSPKYWEFNLSPAGNWNVFRFPDYRQSIAEEMVFTELSFTVLQQSNSCKLNLKVNLNKIISVNQDLLMGISTVIENRNQQLSYWALNHPASEADFHHQDSFIFNL